MVKAGSRPHGPQEEGHQVTGAAQGAMYTRGRAQRGGWRRPPAISLDAQTPPASVSAPFSSVALTHQAVFSFTPP